MMVDCPQCGEGPVVPGDKKCLGCIDREEREDSYRWLNYLQATMYELWRCGDIGSPRRKYAAFIGNNPGQLERRWGPEATQEAMECLAAVGSSAVAYCNAMGTTEWWME